MAKITADLADTPGAQALTKGLDVLLAIGAADGPVRFGDIAEAVKMPAASLHRLLAALVSRNLIRYDRRRRRYEIGVRILELSRRSLDGSEIIRAAKPEMARLSRSAGLTILLMIRDGADVFVLDFDDPDPSYGRLVRLWRRSPVMETAAGRALLAAMPRENALELIAEIDPAAAGDARLMSELDMGKALGYVVCRPEVASGRVTVAAAIKDSERMPLAALVVMVDTPAAGVEELHDLGRMLVEAARRASSQIGVDLSAPYVMRQPAQPAASSVTALPTGRDFVGESPIWDDRRKKLFWVDVLAPALRWFDPADQQSGRTALPAITAGLALDRQGQLIGCGQGGFSLIDPDSGRVSALFNPETDRPDNRFNTAGVDPRGRIWAGTMALDQTPRRGRLYSIDHSLLSRRHPAPAGAPRNPVFSLDGTCMYVADADLAGVQVYDFDVEAGLCSNPRLLIEAEAGAGRPNGMTIDSEGHLWIAWVGGWSVRRYDPDGRLVEEVSLPVPMPTGCAFGGAGSHTLYVTNTYIRMPPGLTAEAPAAGQLLSIETRATGNAVLRCW